MADSSCGVVELRGFQHIIVWHVNAVSAPEGVHAIIAGRPRDMRRFRAQSLVSGPRVG